MTNHLYHYKAHVLEVCNGDTIIVQIDLGFSINLNQKLRLYEVNPIQENDSESDSPSKLALQKWLLDKEVLLESIFLNKHQHALTFGIVHFLEDGKWINANDRLVAEKLAIEVEY
ncbi:MAG: hypothetical protein WEC59_06195 [Salibacteraceae bacterium]